MNVMRTTVATVVNAWHIAIIRKFNYVWNCWRSRAA